MIEDKNYVGIANCFICGEAKYLLIDKRLRNILPREAVYDKEPCDKCKWVLERGVIFIGIRDGEPKSDNPHRTGQIVGIKNERIKGLPIIKSMKEDILKKRVCYVEESALKKMGLVNKNGTLKFKKKLEIKD
jgi:hypothetical protein